MTHFRPRRAWAAAAATVLALAGSSDIAHAAAQTLVGVDRVTFSWQPASGNPSLYQVRRSLNGGALQTYAIASTNSITIPVTAGDQLAISVKAGAYDDDGAFVMGPASAVSDLVTVVAAPKFAKPGQWLLRCPTCPSLESRSVSDASKVIESAAGLPQTWAVLGRVTLAGEETIVWHNTNTGAVQLWDWMDLAPLSISTVSAGTGVRGVGAADLDGNGTEEFLTQRTDTLAVSVWALTSSGFRPVAQISAPAGARLAAARDFNSDGRVDLLWHYPATGVLDLARFGSNPVLGTGGTVVSLAASLLTRLTSGVPTTAAVASTADYDADGAPDVLLRYASGALRVLYMRSTGTIEDWVSVPSAADDVNRVVIASRSMNDRSGAEIVLQHRLTGEISFVDPLVTNLAQRTVLLSAGAKWQLVGS